MKTLSLFALLVLFGGQIFSGQSRDAFTVAVLQSHGSLIPFATYDGTKWLNSWPEPGDSGGAMVDAPIGSLNEIPSTWTAGLRLPELWRLWLPTNTSQELRILRAAYVKSACSE